jgi:hypothetical protein
MLVYPSYLTALELSGHSNICTFGQPTMPQPSNAPPGHAAVDDIVSETSQLSLTTPIPAIPPRVKCRIALDISRSGVVDGGYGVFAKEPIKEGKLVFSIKQPFFTMVGLCYLDLDFPTSLMNKLRLMK